jgi:hypothetical protein
VHDAESAGATGWARVTNAKKMFGARGTSSAFGSPIDMGLAGAPNAVPMPSGGFDPPSVNNTSLENVTNDIPSTLVFPCNKGKLQHDRVQPADFVFVLREKIGEQFQPAVKFQPAYNRRSGTETALVSLPMLNEILRDEADKAREIGEKDHWTADVCKVAEWATPFGAVLNLARTGTLEGRTGSHGRAFTRDAVNVCVGRRATVKNNFYSASRGQEINWSSSSMQRVAVQYSKESVKLNANGDEVDVVLVTMVLADCPDIEGMCNQPGHIATGCCRPRESSDGTTEENGTLCIDAQFPEKISIENQKAFARNPVEKDALLVPIGRVLHSAPRTPTAHEALHSCIIRNAYDRLGPIEILLGCP